MPLSRFLPFSLMSMPRIGVLGRFVARTILVGGVLFGPARAMGQAAGVGAMGEEAPMPVEEPAAPGAEAPVEPELVRLFVTHDVITPEVLEVPEGAYIFEFTNDDVEAYLEFAVATKTEGGGIGTVLEQSLLREPVYRGERAQTGILYLEPGEYVYYVVDDPDPLHTLTVVPSDG